MSKNVAMFVDVANMYYAARGQDVDVDYVALLKHVTKGRDLIRAYAYTGLDPENENQRKFIDFLSKNGYKPVVKDIRKFGDGRMKANLDIELVVDLFRLADRMDIAVIVSGDGDFAPAIKALQDKGVRAEVISFKPNTSSDLIAVADEFMDIMKVASISRKDARTAREAGMSAPEMPAKEVTPEFGFREASPSVAAAALAALKGGATADTGRRGARAGAGRRVAAAASPAAEPAGERAPAAILDVSEADQDARRRRRRRGGRGRGRARRDDETLPVAAGEEEIGWEEFDDLSQLDGVPEDREYGFEEADAATLAELGLTPDEVATMAVPAAEAAGDEPSDDAATASKPRRRSTRSKADAGAGEAPAAKPRRRSSRAKADETAAETGQAAGADEAPKPRRRSPRATSAQPAESEAPAAEADTPKSRRSGSRAADAPSAPTVEEQPVVSEASASGESGEPQGIWGRFRTARKPRAAAKP